MSKIRGMPRTFDGDWQAEMKALGVRVPTTVRTLRYTPVNHDPTPFSVDIDLDAMRVVKKTVGVIPNAAYGGHIYRWDEFRELIETEKNHREQPARQKGENDGRE